MNVLLVGYDVDNFGWYYGDLSGAKSGKEPKGVNAAVKGLEACDKFHHQILNKIKCILSYASTYNNMLWIFVRIIIDCM